MQIKSCSGWIDGPMDPMLQWARQYIPGADWGLLAGALLGLTIIGILFFHGTISRIEKVIKTTWKQQK